MALSIQESALLGLPGLSVPSGLCMELKPALLPSQRRGPQFKREEANVIQRLQLEDVLSWALTSVLA